MESKKAECKARTKISLLPPGVAERIAAGEVIERPASVIKELVENSLDAGATEVAVILEDGGKSLIEILDNGHGMAAEDLALSIERHATSKLSSLEDLEKIATLGFRGEALASVAAVSDLSIVSRTADSKDAYELLAGDVTQRRIEKPSPSLVTFGYFLNSHHGTRIRATGLFSQIPARLKFLKSQAAEVTQTREWLERLALAYPHVGFRLVSNDRTVLTLRPEDEVSRVRAILSDGDDYPVVTAEHEQDGFRDLGLKVRLHWVQGLSTSNSRKLIQVVNSRAVKDRVLQQAVLTPFRQALLPGQYPAVALFIDINPAAIDVNVHPSKIEIRFLDTRKIFSSIDTLVKSMISRHGAPAIAAPSFRPPLGAPAFQESSSPLLASPIAGLAVDMTKEPAFAPLATSLAASLGTPLQINSPPLTPPTTNTYDRGNSFSGNWSKNEYRSEKIFPVQDKQPSRPNFGGTVSLWKASEAGPQQGDSSNSFDSNSYTDYSQKSAPTTSAKLDPLEFSRYAGTLFNTYLIYEKKNEVILVDQHAAHERIRYENLRKKFLRTSSSPSASKPEGAENSPSALPAFHSQALLIPEAIRVSTENRQVLADRLKQISYFGFEAGFYDETQTETDSKSFKSNESENLSDSIVLFRAVPAEWGFNQLKPRLRNLIDRLLSLNDPTTSNGEIDSSIVLDETLFELLASEACHSSVRAGDPLELQESSNLVEQLFKCEHPWNCPHGRPTVVYLPQAKFEEWFQRRV
ncbi:MAG: DNA mismatch repair endonuclease MutL [Bdellovibrionia bacterium]